MHNITKQSLTAAGLRPGDLGRLTGTHPTTVSRWLNGTMVMPLYARTIVDAWPHLPDDIRSRLLDGEHLSGTG
jgi:hypothetical protein